MTTDDASDEYLKAVGRVAVYGAKLEFKLAFCVVGLLGMDAGRGLRVASELSASRLIRLVRDLVSDLPDKAVAKEVEKRLGRAKQLTERRNRAIHDAYGTDPEGHGRNVQMRTGTSRPVNVEELNQLADGLNNVGTEILQALELWLPSA